MRRKGHPTNRHPKWWRPNITAQVDPVAICLASTETVKKHIRAAVNAVNDDATPLDRPVFAINRLYALFQQPGGKDIVSPVISQYPATATAQKRSRQRTGAARIQPALDAWMLELVIFDAVASSSS